MAESKSQNDKEDQNENLSPSEQRTEYFNKLEKWLFEASAWYTFMATVPAILASSQFMPPGAVPTAAAPNVGATLANANINTNNQQDNGDGLRQRRVNEPAATQQFEAPGVTGL